MTQLSRRSQPKGVMINMMDKTLKGFTFPDDFADIVADLLEDFRSDLADCLPEDIRELAMMAKDELKKRRNKLLRSLAGVLSVDLEKLELEREQNISVSELSDKQRDYVWRTLHELDLIEFIETMLARDTIFTRLVQDFDSLEVEVGLFDMPDSEWYNRPYIKIAGPPDPDGYRCSMQRAIDPDGGRPPSIQTWSG